MTHEHTYVWRIEPEGVVWSVEARCDCGDVAFGLTARDNEHLNAELSRAYQIGSIGASNYFGAPVAVPDDWPTVAA